MLVWDYRGRGGWADLHVLSGVGVFHLEDVGDHLASASVFNLQPSAFMVPFSLQPSVINIQRAALSVQRSVFSVWGVGRAVENVGFRVSGWVFRISGSEF